LQRVATLLPYESACREYVAELMNRSTKHRGNLPDTGESTA